MLEETRFWNNIVKFAIVISSLFMIILVNSLIISTNFYIKFLSIILFIMVFITMLIGILLNIKNEN